MKKKLKKIAVDGGILLAAVITLFALWSTWENWTGAREWEKTKATLVAENVELDLKKLIPKMPRPEDNFARTPLIASLTDFEYVRPKTMEEMSKSSSDIKYKTPKLRERFQAIQLPKTSNLRRPFPSWTSGLHADLEAVREALVKEGQTKGSILDWMAQFEREFAEIDAAAERPFAQMPVDVGDTFPEHISTILPFMSDIIGFQRVQTIRACAALEVGDHEQAKTALQTTFQMRRTASSYPTLIGFLVGQASLNNALSIIWQGLDANQWTKDDLLWIQNQLGKVEVLSELEKSLSFEMVAFQIAGADFFKSAKLRDTGELVKLIGPLSGKTTSSPIGALAFFVPSGVWDHNKALGCRVFFKNTIRPIRESRFPEPTSITSELEDRNHRNFLAAIMLPSVSTVIERGFQEEVAADLARIACAVERYRIDNNDYPDSLASLPPKFIDKIPADLMAPEKPLNYKKGAFGDRYRIYSVGGNGTDEGGKIVFKGNNQPAQRDLKKGDWAWGYVF